MELKDFYNFGAANARCQAQLCQRRPGQSWWEAVIAAEAHSRLCDCKSDHDCFWCLIEEAMNTYTHNGQLCSERAWQRYQDGIYAGIRKGLKERGIPRSEWYTPAAEPSRIPVLAGVGAR